MSISDYFSKQFGSSAPAGGNSYSWGGKYGSVDLYRPSIGSLDLGVPVMEAPPGKVTGSIDGSSPSVDWLKGLTSVVLQNMGSKGDGGGAQVTPVAYGSGGNDGGGMSWGVIALGAVAVGAVIYASQAK
ncbi:hypothetical protein [Tritonibacter scottomollicae]|uniref:Uncharacterized protein n=1 Tax=Tritonibacter scottomollicae TaxID=483013 RepID=A0A2T1AHE8_TRISK|nr:hypothetical protein [Tritonibacter scottomollicae]PRZ48004.1 hypothetical protein CLV89_105229 [Tritonibacter scottomollicae]